MPGGRCGRCLPSTLLGQEREGGALFRWVSNAARTAVHPSPEEPWGLPSGGGPDYPPRPAASPLEGHVHARGSQPRTPDGRRARERSELPRDARP